MCKPNVASVLCETVEEEREVIAIGCILWQSVCHHMGKCAGLMDFGVSLLRQNVLCLASKIFCKYCVYMLNVVSEVVQDFLCLQKSPTELLGVHTVVCCRTFGRMPALIRLHFLPSSKSLTS